MLACAPPKGSPPNWASSVFGLIELHQALVMGGHVAHLHLAGGQLVGAEHGDHARAHLVGQLELAFQAAVLVIHLGGHARIAACLHQA